MGNFKGHALPGTFFLLFGLWWSVKYPLKYILKKKNKNVCYIMSAKGFHQLEVAEGIVKAAFALIGMVAEQFVPDGPHLKLYNYEEKQWNHLMNWQHGTMYLFYGMSGLVDIMAHTSSVVPLAMDRLMFSTAAFVEGFMFYYHVHGRLMLDVHVHQLLLVAIFGVAFCLFLEVFLRGNLGLELLRTSFFILQGTWFWQIGFILYPPNGAEWNLLDSNNMMFVTMCFCWHFAFSILVVAISYSIVYWVTHSKLKKEQPVELGLLKSTEQDRESDEELQDFWK
ncbi:transmembrane protein 45A [Protopterus annectens]|uniref:transmembrane protein 45A n=1 Tax=Protopterus annectens TaxID=7888 RepID=UPI001CF9CED9|nr:transmembrane protein 45A [Protopterus annectens]